VDRLPEFAADLVRLKMDLIVANGYPAILAARRLQLLKEIAPRGVDVDEAYVRKHAVTVALG